MGLLGRVDQQEEECEGASGHSALLNTQPVDPPEQVLERRCIALVMTSPACRNAELFDNLE
jgi:hypothetical protein